MYHEESNTAAVARTSSLNEELGQVQYIFSDKTGTLTENIMLFRRFSVGGAAFTHTGSDEAGSVALEAPQPDVDTSGDVPLPTVISDTLPLRAMSSTLASTSAPLRSPRTAAALDHRSSRDLALLRSDGQHADLTNAADQLLLAIALCHTVVPSAPDGGAGAASAVHYQGSSPDEVALVQGAAELGCALAYRRAELLGVRGVDNGVREYEVLHVLQFTSERKRMSVIYRYGLLRADGIRHGAGFGVPRSVVDAHVSPIRLFRKAS